MVSVAAGQTYQGRISGTVVDSTGAVIVGAKLLILNVDTGLQRQAVTTDSGEFAAPNLPPGPYRITVSAPNFKTLERSGVHLEVAKEAHLDLQLVPGASGDSITITEEAPLVDVTSDTLGGTMSNKAINDLPLNGRDFQNLVVLRPGVQRNPGGGFLSISSNGNRPEDNNFIVDGTDNNDPYYATTVINAEGVQGTPGTHLPIDAIQEFNAAENPPAEYGWKPGAIVNVGLKSGTNDLHGTAYYFHRNNAFDARNYFNAKPDPQKPLRLHQYGATIGGPIIRNRFFFFAGYEGVRDLVGNSETLSSPATTPVGDPSISIPDAVASLQGRGIPVNPLSVRMAALFPANSSSDGSLNLGFPNTNREDNGLFKLDYRINDHQNITGRYFIGDSVQTERDIPVLRKEWMSQSVLRAQVIGANWTWAVGPRLVNEAKFGYNRFWQSILTADANVDPNTYGINTGVTNSADFGMPEIAVSGFTSLGGNHGWPLLTTPNQTFQFADNVTYTFGKHVLRFGGEARHGTTTNLRDRYGKGRIRFNGDLAYPGSSALEDFMAGLPKSSGGGRIFVGDSLRHVSINSFGAFIQDDIRLTPRFTVNLGLRYDLSTVIKEKDNLLGNFDPTTGLVQVGKDVDGPYDGDHNNFAPRIGAAWDVMGNGKTVIRFGGGVIYEIPHLAAFLGQNGVNNASTAGLNVIPTGAIGVTPGGGSIIAASTNVAASDLNWSINGPVFNLTNVDCSATPCDILAVDKHLRTPYVFTYNVNVQQALTNSLVLQVGYVANRGIKLYGIRDINQVDPNSAAEIACGACEQDGRPFATQFPFLGFVNFMANNYTSDYHGLQVSATQRFSHGVNFVLGYTWAHSIDFVSLNRANQPQDSNHPERERASSDLDIRHRFTLAFSYDLPARKSWGQLLEGWQVNNIVTLQTGTPFTAWDFGDDTSFTGEFSDRWNQIAPISSIKQWSNRGPIDVASVLAPPTCPGECFGNNPRNAFRGPGFKDWDLSIVKNWKVTEKLGMQLRAEFFNVLNHPNFANPAILFNNDLSVPSFFGYASATPDVAAANPVVGTGGPRNIQLGLKFRW
jgi:hypothetical protein